MARQIAAKPNATAASPGCQLTELFALMGKAHMLDILHHFLEEADGPVRFVTLQRTLRLSPNTLSDRLKQLVEAGLLTRFCYHEIPPRVDYHATTKAHDLKPVFQRLTRWADKHNLRPFED